MDNVDNLHWLSTLERRNARSPTFFLFFSVDNAVDCGNRTKKSGQSIITGSYTQDGGTNDGRAGHS